MNSNDKQKKAMKKIGRKANLSRANFNTRIFIFIKWLHQLHLCRFCKEHNYNILQDRHTPKTSESSSLAIPTVMAAFATVAPTVSAPLATLAPTATPAVSAFLPTALAAVIPIALTPAPAAASPAPAALRPAPNPRAFSFSSLFSLAPLPSPSSWPPKTSSSSSSALWNEKWWAN